MTEHVKPRQRARELGLPDYFDMQAELGQTKHLGGLIATRELAEMCHIEPGMEVLNVGSGAGLAAITLAQEYDVRVLGVDLLEKMVDISKQWAQRRGAAARTEFRVADAQDLPFEDDRFDALVSESVNTFVPDAERAAREYARVVRPGRYVGLNEGIWIGDPPDQGEAYMGSLIGQRFRTSEEWVAILEGAGLVDVVAREHAVKMGREARGQFGFLGVGDYLKLLGRFFSKFLFRPDTRALMRTALSTPKGLFRHMGYGLYAGRVP
jgi:arsenite methyltransferase